MGCWQFEPKWAPYSVGSVGASWLRDLLFRLDVELESGLRCLQACTVFRLSAVPFAMLKWAARLFCKLLCRHRSFCPSSCSIFRPVLRVEPPAAYLQLIFLLLMAEAVPQASCSMVQSEPRSFDSAPCQTNIPGDCNPYSCHGTCEGRYARFWDSKLKIDRTVKSCQCVQVRLAFSLNSWNEWDIFTITGLTT